MSRCDSKIADRTGGREKIKARWHGEMPIGGRCKNRSQHHPSLRQIICAKKDKSYCDRQKCSSPREESAQIMRQADTELSFHRLAQTMQDQYQTVINTINNVSPFRSMPQPKESHGNNETHIGPPSITPPGNSKRIVYVVANPER